MKHWQGLVLVLLLSALSIAPACKKPEPEVVPPKQYARKVMISTYDTKVLSIKLAKGEVLEGHFGVWVAKIRTTVEPLKQGRIIFYIVDYYGETIIDAGDVIGGYEFEITADRTRQYNLFFDDRHGDSVIILDYNSPTPLVDITYRYK